MEKAKKIEPTIIEDKIIYIVEKLELNKDNWHEPKEEYRKIYSTYNNDDRKQAELFLKAVQSDEEHNCYISNKEYNPKIFRLVKEIIKREIYE